MKEIWQREIKKKCKKNSRFCYSFIFLISKSLELVLFSGYSLLEYKVQSDSVKVKRQMSGYWLTVEKSKSSYSTTKCVRIS